MPYTTLVAGTTITASWANANVRDQVVTPFASTAARDSAITSPVFGMLEAVTSNDSAEGLTMFTSASTWRKPWNMPWGVLSYVEVVANQTGISTGPTDLTSLTSGSLTMIGNRRVRATGQGRTTQNTSTGAQELWINDSVAGALNRTTFTVGATNFVWHNVHAVVVPSAAAHVYKLQLGTTAGTVDLAASSSQPASLLIEDLGPSGAPA